MEDLEATIGTPTGSSGTENNGSLMATDNVESRGYEIGEEDIPPSLKKSLPSQKYPPTCYSMIAKGARFTAVFGIFVVVVQVSLLFMMFWGFESAFPRNIDKTANVKATQFLAILGFFLFSRNCMEEGHDAIRLCPFTKEQLKKNKRVLLACVIRFIACMVAVIITTILILNRDTPFAIILAITVVETITRFDEFSFNKAKIGRYGSWMQKQALELEEKEIPDYAHKGTDTGRFRKKLFHLFQVLIFIYMMSYWIIGLFTTEAVSLIDAITEPPKSVKVSFPYSSGFEEYNGCYVRSLRNETYYYEHSLLTNSSLGYCDNDGVWTFSVNTRNPCRSTFLISEKLPKDVDQLFKKQWYTPKGEPFETYFLRVEKNTFCDTATTTTTIAVTNLTITNATVEALLESSNVTLTNATAENATAGND